MKKYYTYCYFDENGVPFYIGCGSGNRLNDESRKFPIPPPERRLILKENLSREEGFRHEIYMINVLGRRDLGTGCLINETDGGPGMLNPRPELVESIKRGRLGKGSTRKPDTGKKQSRSRCKWYVFTDPDGVEHKLYTTIRKFSIENGLVDSNMRQVCRGERPQHRGWSVRRVSP